MCDNFSNHVPEHSNYITSNNIEVSSQTDHQNINNIQTSTANSSHRTVITRKKENDKNHEKPNTSQLNSKICDNTHVNKNSYNSTKEREPLDQPDKKSESEKITDQSNPSTLY